MELWRRWSWFSEALAVLQSHKFLNVLLEGRKSHEAIVIAIPLHQQFHVVFCEGRLLRRCATSQGKVHHEVTRFHSANSNIDWCPGFCIEASMQVDTALLRQLSNLQENLKNTSFIPNRSGCEATSIKNRDNGLFDIESRFLFKILNCKHLIDILTEL